MKQLKFYILVLSTFVIDTVLIGTIIFCLMSVIWWVEDMPITLAGWIGCLIGYHLIDTTRAKIKEISIEVKNFLLKTRDNNA